MAKNYLLELLQAASNASAGNVSGPVDLLAAGMRKLGIPVNDPVLGSEWMRRQGLTREVADPYLNAAGATLGMVAPIGVAAKAPQIAAGVNQMVRNAQVPMSPGAAQRGAVVWHGSQHKFDKFDSSRIGSGEGAQSYGHGLYFAESPRVAKSYQEALGAGKGNSDADTIARALDVAGGDASKAAAILEQRAVYANIPGGKERLLSLAENVRSGADPRGAMYKADLSDAAIQKMLDWDGDGKEIWQSAVRVHGSAVKAAQALRAQGMPGIRYLDGGSRLDGTGTSNYVVFPGEENAIVRILERNGQPLK